MRGNGPGTPAFPLKDYANLKDVHRSWTLEVLAHPKPSEARRPAPTRDVLAGRFPGSREKRCSEIVRHGAFVFIWKLHTSLVP